jgi:phosphoserine phosphatase RsbX
MTAALTWAGAHRPIAGEVECGDLSVVESYAEGTTIGVFDGLGHGPEAAAAARIAEAVLRRSPDLPPLELIHACHKALRGSRGAAGLVASASTGGMLSWVGVGNVEGWRVCRPNSGRRREALISSAGVLGYQIPTLRSRTLTLAPSDLLAFSTDGVSSSFVESVVPGTELAGLADRLLLMYGRPNDDALVLLARFEGQAA